MNIKFFFAFKFPAYRHFEFLRHHMVDVPLYLFTAKFLKTLLIKITVISRQKTRTRLSMTPNSPKINRQQKEKRKKKVKKD